MFNFLWNIIKKSKFQTKEHYKNLKEITILDIYKQILNDKDILSDKYKINSVYLYGSFAKGKERIDSDIDLAVIFSPELLQETKKIYLDELSERYYRIFNRFVDLHEISNYLCDNVIK